MPRPSAKTRLTKSSADMAAKVRSKAISCRCVTPCPAKMRAFSGAKVKRNGGASGWKNAPGMRLERDHASGCTDPGARMSRLDDQRLMAAMDTIEVPQRDRGAAFLGL